MTNWRLIAEARATGIAGSDIDRIAPVLEALERDLEPLVAQLNERTEPAIVLSESAISGE